MSTQIWVNDRDIVADLGVTRLSVSGIENWSAGFSRTREIVQLANGSNVKGRTLRAQPRMVRIKAYIDPATIAERDNEIARLLDAFGGDVIELRFSDAPDLVLYGELMSEAVTDFYDAFLFPDIAVTLNIECADPARYDRDAQIVSFDDTHTEVPLGTLESFGAIVISGPTGATFDVEYFKNDSTLKGTMTFTVTLAAEDSLEIDLDERTVTLSDNGVESNGLDLLTAGDFFSMEPTDGSFLLAAWPRIAVSDGTGVLTYRRRWK